MFDAMIDFFMNLWRKFFMKTPEITSVLTATNIEGKSFSYQITATNSPTSFAASPLPAGLTVNKSTGLISGTSSVNGIFNITISATNQKGTGSATLKLTITAPPPPPPPAPVIDSVLIASGMVEDSFNYQIIATNNPTSFDATNLPNGLIINQSTGLIAGTLNTIGNFTINLTATNSGGTGMANLVLTIAALPPPPPPPPATKGAPHGIFKLLGTDRYLTESESTLNNLGVTGYRIRLRWAGLEPVEGQYQWNGIKDSITIAKAHNKKLSIGVGPLPDFDDISQPDACPIWLEGVVGDFIHITTSEGPAKMPWMWNPIFQEKWKNFNMAMGHEFDAEPVIDYVVVGGLGSSHMETYITRLENTADVAAFKAAGGYDAWVGAGKVISQFYSDAWPNTPFVITTGQPIDEPEGTTAMLELCDWWKITFPKHGGFMNAKFKLSSDPTKPEMAIIKNASDTNPVGFQTGIVSGFGADLAATLDHASDDFGAYFIELSGQDCIDANTSILVDKAAKLRTSYIAG
jgi:PKD repeat protein